MSYSYLSQVNYPTTTVQDKATLIILGDQNPRCTLGTTGIGGAGLAANTEDNSANHDGEGQFVATYDGRVSWISSPSDTDTGDDIYAANDAEGDPFANENQGQRGYQDDVFLIP